MRISLNSFTFHLCILFFMFQMPFDSWAQQTVAIPHYLSLQGGYGWDLNPKSPKNNSLYQIQLGYHQSLAPLDKPWIKRIQAQQAGIHLGFYQLDRMREEVNGVNYPGGVGVSVHGDVELKLIQLGTTRILFKPGMGLAYLTQTAFTQPATSTIGSHLNISLNAYLSWAVPLHQRLELLASGGFQHFSNGGWAVPNGGWNTFIAQLGLRSRLAQDPHKKEHVTEIKTQKHGLELMIGSGVRGKYRDTSKKFYRSGGYLGYRFHQNESLHWKGGVHALYYHSTFKIEHFDQTFQYYGSSYDPWRVGIAIGAAYQMGRFGVEGMYGKYLHYNSFHDIHDYWTLGANYRLWGPIHWQSTLYMHKFQADFVQHGISLRF
jgi:hypothetical protein